MLWARGKGAAAADHVAAVSFLSLFRYADAYDVALMLVGTSAAIVNGLTFPAMVVTRGHIINSFGSLQAERSQISNKVSQSSTFFVYVAIVAWVASYLEVSCWMRTGERQTSKIRMLYLRSILRQNVAYFDTEVSTSEIVNSVSADTLLLQEAISEKAGNFVRNATQFLGCYLVGFTQSWRLSIIVLPFTPLMILPGTLYGKAISTFELRKQATYNKAGSIAEQAISSIRTVYSFGCESRTLSAYSQSLEATVKLGLKQGLAKGLALGSSAITFAVWAFLAWYGSFLVLRGQANGAQVITTGLSLINGARSLGFAISNMKIFAEGRIAAYKIFQTINRVPPIDVDDPKGKQLPEVVGRLQLKSIVYSYPSRPDVAVLKDFTLDIPPGKRVALVGSSGSGKSTIISLLERFYDPLQGEVLLDGVNIRTLQLRWYRRQIGLVSQEPALFATSIQDNIMYGKEDASMDEIVQAAKSANAHNFIMNFPNGYDTQVGERGVQMSGGQKQRIAIARAMIKHPPILLLDEATSALDTESETIVQAALEKASSGHTTVIVAHRLSTIRNADLIAVLQSGKLAELGTHEELLLKGEDGAYAALVHLQEAASAKDKQSSSKEHHEELKSDASASFKASQEEESAADDQPSAPSCTNKRASEASSKATFWNLLALSTPEWKQGLMGLAGAIGFGLVQPTYSFLFGGMVNVYYNRNEEQMEEQVMQFSFIFAAISVASFVVNVVQHYNLAAVGERLTKHVRERLLGGILRFEVGWFDKDENTSGAICSRLATDANMIRALITDRISLLVQTASAVCVSFIIGLVVSWRLGLLMVGIQPLLIFCYYIKLVFLKGFTKKAAKAQNEASQIASESVSQHRTITAFSSQDRVLAFLKSKLDVAVDDNKKRSHMAGFGLGLAHFILYASWGLQFWYGGILFKQGKASFQDVFKVFFVFLSTGRVIAEALSLTPDMAKSAAAIESVFSILHRKTQIDGDDRHAEKVEKIQGNVELCNVEFAYPSRPNVMIFRNLNFQVAAGRTVALVGQSGSGKSTIIGLIERFYDPLRGLVKIDGKDIKTLHLQTLRRHIALVSQEPTLFATSIQENIAYGQEGSTAAEVVEAARVANAHNFISALPNGYETFAGERGLQLSGGQKQRIAIARAVLKNPAILLLDEATSALDTESEHLVQDALNRIMVGRTTVVVAHRLSTIKNCDSIAVIQDGAILEQGTHEELLAKGEQGAYFSLIHLQSAGH